MKKKILITFGTRPELIKLLSVILELEKNKKYKVFLCNTAQHVELLNPLLKFYSLQIDFNLNILKPRQSLSLTTSKILERFDKVIKKLKPDCIIVQGDTNTAFACALSAFYNKTKIFHVEAGLRTNNIYSPWPEEINRRFISQISNFNFAPTSNAQINLIDEGILKSKILITGNTVIDLLKITLFKINNNQRLSDKFKKKFNYLNDSSFKILLSAHRRENFGKGMKNIFLAINKISKDVNIKIIYSVHPNPEIKKAENRYLIKKKNVIKIKNQNYVDFVYLMNKVNLIISDSGGIQEEAPSLGKPNLVLRDYTERPETIKSKSAVLVGTDQKRILKEFNKLMNSKQKLNLMSRKINLYGNGKAYLKIVKKINSILI